MDKKKSKNILKNLSEFIFYTQITNLNFNLRGYSALRISRLFRGDKFVLFSQYYKHFNPFKYVASSGKRLNQSLQDCPLLVRGRLPIRVNKEDNLI